MKANKRKLQEKFLSPTERNNNYQSANENFAHTQELVRNSRHQKLKRKQLEEKIKQQKIRNREIEIKRNQQNIRIQKLPVANKELQNNNAHNNAKYGTSSTNVTPKTKHETHTKKAAKNDSLKTERVNKSRQPAPNVRPKNMYENLNNSNKLYEQKVVKSPENLKAKKVINKPEELNTKKAVNNQENLNTKKTVSKQSRVNEKPKRTTASNPKSSYSYKVTTFDLILHSFAKINYILLIIIGAIAKWGIPYVNFFAEVQIYKVPTNWIVISSLIVIGATFLKTFLLYYNYTVSMTDKKYIIECGLLRKRRYEVRKSTLKGIKISKSITQQIFRVKTIYMLNSTYPGDAIYTNVFKAKPVFIISISEGKSREVIANLAPQFSRAGRSINSKFTPIIIEFILLAGVSWMMNMLIESKIEYANFRFYIEIALFVCIVGLVLFLLNRARKVFLAEIAVDSNEFYISTLKGITYVQYVVSNDAVVRLSYIQGVVSQITRVGEIEFNIAVDFPEDALVKVGFFTTKEYQSLHKYMH